MNELYALLVPYFSSLAGIACIRPQQNAPAPLPPYMTLDIRSVVPQGTFRDGVDENGVVSSQRNYNFTVDLNIYGSNNSPSEAESICTTVLNGLENVGYRILELQGKLAFQQILSPPTDVTSLIGKQFQPRYNIAMRWNTSELFSYNAGVIEQVEIEAVV